MVIIGKKALARYLGQFGVKPEDLPKFLDMKSANSSYEAVFPELKECIKNLNDQVNALKEKNEDLAKELKDRPSRDPTEQEINKAAEKIVKSNATEILKNLGDFKPKSNFNPAADLEGDSK